MATDTLRPNEIITQTNLTGAYTDIDEDPDSPGSDWLLAAAADGGVANAYLTSANNAVPTGLTNQWTSSSAATGSSESKQAVCQVQGADVRAGNHFYLTGAFSSVPVDATITALTVEARHWATVTNGGTWGYRLDSSPDIAISSERTTTSVGNTAPGAGSAGTNGTWYGTAALWTTLPTRAQLNNGTFGVRAVFTSTSNIVTASLDWIRVSISWERPAASNNTVCRAGFPTPTGTLTSGAALQQFKVLVRKQGSGTNPSCTVSLRETSGSSNLATVVATTAVSSTSGVVLSGTFNANLLADSSGAATECYVSGSGAAGGALEVGAIEWNYDYITPAVTKSLDIRWDTRELVEGALDSEPFGITKSLVWNTRTRIADSASLSWHTRASLGDTGDFRWALRALSGDNTSLRWNTKSLAADSTDIRFNTYATVGDSADLRWRTGISYSVNVSLENPTNRLRLGEGLQNWAARVRKTGTGDDPLFRLELHEAGGPLLYTVIDDTPVSSDTVLTGHWDAQLLADTVGLDVEARLVSNSFADDTAVEIAALQWDASMYDFPTEPINADTDLRWALRSLVNNQSDIRWDLKALVADTLDARWHTRCLTSDDTDLRWALRTLVANNSNLQWDIHTLAAQDADLLWSVRVPVEDDLSLAWAVRVRTQVDLDILWALKALLAKDSTLYWDTHGIVTAIADEIDLRWHTRSMTESDLNLLWATYVRVGDATDLRWSTFSNVITPRYEGLIIIPFDDRGVVVREDDRGVVVPFVD